MRELLIKWIDEMDEHTLRLVFILAQKLLHK